MSGPMGHQGMGQMGRQGMPNQMMPNQMMQRTRTSKFESETFINSALAMQPSGPNITMPPQNNMNMMRGGWPPGGQHQMPNQRLVSCLCFMTRS